MKKVKLMGISMIFSALFSFSAMAGSWLTDESGSQWLYQKDDGSYAAGTWELINGEYYYFGVDGILYQDTVTPDGYLVGINGEWIDAVSASDKTLTLEKTGTVYGVLKKIEFGYEGLSTYTSYILTLPYSAAVYGERGDYLRNETEFQIVDGRNDLDAYVGQTIRVSGTVIEGLTASYARDFAVLSSSVELAEQ